MSATATPSLSLSSFRPRFQNQSKTHNLSPLSWSVSSRKILVSDKQVPRVFLNHEKAQLLWRLSVTPEDISQEIATSSSSTAASDSSSSSAAVVSTGGDDGVAVVIQVLLLIAFLALTVLTIGVVYIGVTDFLGKREREKFEKEEAAKRSKKSGKKKPTRAKAGPRGFGQKIEADDYYDDADIS